MNGLFLYFPLILEHLQRPLHGELAASFGGAPLSFGPAPVTAVLKCGKEGLDGVGRPQQAVRCVYMPGFACTRVQMHVHAHSFLVKLGRGMFEVPLRSLKLCARARMCVCVFNPVNKNS